MAETCEEEIKSGSPPPLNRAPSRQSSSAGRNNFGLGLYSLVFFLIVPRDFQNQNETNDSANKELLILVQLKKNTLYFWNSPTAVEDFMFVTIFAQQWSRIIYQRVNIYNFSSKYICQLHFQAVVAMVLSITKETENAGLEIVLEGCSYYLDHTFIPIISW